MRQRNDTHTALYAPADPPFEVLPGETIDYPVHLTGLTQLDDEPAKATGGSTQPAALPRKKVSAGKAPTGEEPTE